MPFAPPPRTPSGPRRRALLVSAAGAVLLAGCSSGPEKAGDSTGSSPTADDRARARAARDSEALVERYDAVIAAHPGLAERLGPLREEAVRHARAFGEGRKVSTPSPTVSPSVSVSASAPVAEPGSEKDALAGLAAAERDLAERRAQALLEVPGELARLLASVAAAGAAHVYLLTEGDG